MEDKRKSRYSLIDDNWNEVSSRESDQVPDFLRVG
jgi:hypothetical protein